MDATKQLAEPPEAEAEAPPDARARARIYLDLWERQLVYSAIHGRAAAGMRPPAR